MGFIPDRSYKHNVISLQQQTDNENKETLRRTYFLEEVCKFLAVPSFAERQLLPLFSFHLRDAWHS